jgi:hypothetical protein
VRRTAIEQALREDLSTNPARSGIAATLRPLSSRASVTLKSAGSNESAHAPAVSAPSEATPMSFIVGGSYRCLGGTEELVRRSSCRKLVTCRRVPLRFYIPAGATAWPSASATAAARSG